MPTKNTSPSKSTLNTALITPISNNQIQNILPSSNIRMTISSYPNNNSTNDFNNERNTFAYGTTPNDYFDTINSSNLFNSINSRNSTTSKLIMSDRLTLYAMNYQSNDNENISPKVFKGRISTWRGIIFLILTIALTISLITYYTIQTKNDVKARIFQYDMRLYNSQRINDTNNKNIGGDLISDDGQIGNPKSYPNRTCTLPNYLAENGKFYAVNKGGKRVSISIKGINWSGMETGLATPFGLWDNNQNGTTAYAIASFLSRNNFNSVRIPLCIYHILHNTSPQKDLINEETNRALDLTSYISYLKSLIQVFGYRNISVVLSLHTLTPTDRGDLWYSNDITEDDYLNAVDILGKNLCLDTYWNVIGLDVKNEPDKATWGTGELNDFRLGATKIGNRMISACPNWVAFVEGIYATTSHTVNIDGEEVSYNDWWGSGLQRAGEYPIKLTKSNKVIYSPHYYTPAVYPQPYLYGSGLTELSNSSLKSSVNGTLYDMCGYLNSEYSYTIITGEFGGLYTSDKHPLKTTQRATLFTMESMLSQGFAGGYVWSLNPESAYQYNPFDSAGNFQEGILESDWINVNKPFLDALTMLEKLPDLKPFPCME